MGESSPATGNILLAHGEPESVVALTAILSGGGHRVHSVTTGHSALRSARDVPTDLLLLACELPDLDSFEVCRQLKAGAETSRIPILFILDTTPPWDMAAIFTAGGADYVAKPFQQEKVLSRVQTHLSLAATREQVVEKDAQLARESGYRLRLEAQLQAAQESGLGLVENLSEVIYTADTQGLLTYISPAIQAFLGYHPSEMIGCHVSEFVHGEDHDRLGEQFQHILGGSDTTSEYQALTKAGGMRWMRTSGQPAFEEGRITGVQGVLTDITTRRQAEEQIRQQNEFLTNVLESLTHPFYVVNVNDFTIQIANSAAGLWDQAEAITCHALTHLRRLPCGTADHPCPIEEIKRTKEPFTVEHVHYDASGNPRNVEVNCYPLFDREGNVVRAIEYTLDVTERKQAEEAMRESEEKWRSLAEYSPDYIMLLDRDATILFANHTLPELSREQVIGTSFYDYALEEYRQATQKCFEHVLDTGQPDRFESVYVDGHGNPTVFESYVGPVMRAGEVWGLTVRSTDITERRQAEKALQTLTHELGERVKELNCLYGISKLAGQQDISLEEILQRTVELIPPAFQYPEVTCARIILEDQEFRTSSFTETNWKLDTPLLVHGDQIGALEVYFLKEKPERDEGPFLEEERKLISAVAERLGRIAERVRAEQAMQQSEKEYRQLLEALQEGIWVIDQDANTTFVNPRMAEMLGYSVDEMLGQHLYSFMDERGIKITEHNLERRAQGIQEQHDFEFLRKDGSRIVTLLETSPIYDDDGNYAGGIAGITDITDRREAEDALRQSETLLSETQRIARVGGWDLDLETSRVTWTSEVYRIHQVPLEFDPNLDSALEFYVPEDRPMLQQAIQQAAETGEPWDLELRFVTAKGQRLWVRAIGRAEHTNGKVVRLSGTFQDITELKQAEQALQEAAASAERNRLARDLHDSVTQALFSASLVAEVLPQVWQRDPEVGQQGLEELRLLTRSALAEMRTMLLELRPTALVETRLNDLLWQLTEAITSRAQLAVQFDIEPIPTLPPDVHVTFYRVAQEALHNVIKHADASQVTVSLRASPPVPVEEAGDWRGQVILHLSDDGRGIDHGSTHPGQLGLSIMRERAEAIGAVLTVEGRPDRGTQVTLVWTNTQDR